MRFYLLSFAFFCAQFSFANAQTVLNRGNGSEVDSLQIHQAQGLNAHNVLRDLYEGLMTTDADGKPIYGAASSHVVHGNKWIFTLRKDGRWSDGTPVVASDFVRGWQHAIDPKTASPYAFLLDNIIHAKKIIQLKLSPDNLVVKALDDYTLQVNLWQKDASFLEKLSLPVFFPMAKSTTKNHEIISNGAYKLSKWTVQEKITLTKNPYYRAKDSIYFDTINYWVTEDQSSEIKRFRAGELDITESIADNQIQWLRQNLPEELHISPYLGSFFLGLNVKDKLLSNVALRQALSLAIDRKIIVEKVLKTGQQAAYHIIPRSLLDNQATTSNADDYQQRQKRAKKLLLKSGLNATDISIEILYNNSENQRKVALAVAAMWKLTLGIKVKLLNQEWKVFVHARKSIKRQAFRSGWIADYADAMSFLDLFTSNSPFNFYHYKNYDYDNLIKKINKTMDLTTRKKLIEQAENKLLHDNVVIPLYYYVSRHLVSTKIKGYRDNVADRHLSKYLYK